MYISNILYPYMILSFANEENIKSRIMILRIFIILSNVDAYNNEYFQLI